MHRSTFFSFYLFIISFFPAQLQIEWPVYAAEGAPIQFHLPVVCAHHLNRPLAPNCHIIAPYALDAAEKECKVTPIPNP